MIQLPRAIYCNKLHFRCFPLFIALTNSETVAMLIAPDPDLREAERHSLLPFLRALLA